MGIFFRQDASGSPVRLFIILVACILASNFIIDMIQDAMPMVSPKNALIINSAFLFILTTPLLYFFVVRPMKRHIGMLRQTEETLRESESRYRLLFENMNEGFSLQEIITDENGRPFNFRYIDVNAAYEQHTGLKPANVIGKTLHDILPEAESEQIERYGQIALKGEPIVFEYFSNFFNRHLRIRAFSPQPRLFATIIEDLSDKLAKEKEGAALALRYQTMLNTASDGIHVLDIHGNVVEANDAFCKLLGYTQEEILKLNVADWDAQFDGPDLWVKFNQLIESPEMFETRQKRKDGTIIEVEINASVVVLDGQKYQFASLREITERKKHEREIHLQNEHLQLLNAEKDKFLSIIAHDLRNPFNLLLNASQYIEENYTSMPQQEMLQVIHTIGKSATKLFGMLENLLEWARIQRGLMVADPETFLLKQEVELSLEMLREMALKKNILIETDIPVNLVAYADKKMTDGIVRNLVSNALKFTLPGGKISVVAKMGTGSTIEVAVSDNGIGMSKEMADNLFRIDKHNTRAGTEGEVSGGLGMILVKEFIDKVGGDIRIESEPKKGTTIWFTLPSVA